MSARVDIDGKAACDAGRLEEKIAEIFDLLAEETTTDALAALGISISRVLAASALDHGCPIADAVTDAHVLAGMIGEGVAARMAAEAQHLRPVGHG